MYDSIQIMKRLKELWNIDSDRDLSTKLGVTAQVLSNWKSQNSFDIRKMFDICVSESIDLNWLLTGKEPIPQPISSRVPIKGTPTDDISKVRLEIELECIKGERDRLIEQNNLLIQQLGSQTSVKNSGVADVVRG